jgi:hypothetical protein
LKLLIVIVLVLIILLGGLFLYDRAVNEPPPEHKVIASFYAHRAAFERLREMLIEDQQLMRVAKWGVETTKSLSHPPDLDFPSARYQDYLALLKEAGGLVGERAEGANPKSVGVLVWASGWAGDTRHIEICWSDQEPSPQISSLDQYYRTPKPRHPVFRKIEEHWYLWADW